MDKERKKLLRRKTGWIFLRFAFFMNGILPISWGYFFGWCLGNLAYFIAFPLRHSALYSIKIAYPQFSSRQRKRLARASFIFMIQSGQEVFTYLKNFRYEKNIIIEGKDNLDRALAKGRGVIIVTAHLGNFPLMSYKLARQGYVVNVVVRPMRDSQAGEFFNEIRIAAGVKSILSYPRGECVQRIISALRNNEIVMIQMDQNFGTGGVWVKFFGQLAATPVGPIVFAQRTQTAIVPGYIYRGKRGIRHYFKLFPQEELISSRDRAEEVLLNAIKITNLIEGWIRQVPAQWGWIHRRWKSRPTPAIKQSKFKVQE